MVRDNDLGKILAQVLDDVKREEGKVNLAEISRRTGISRARLRKWQRDGYRIKENGRAGRPSGKSKLDRFSGMIDGKLRQGITNSAVIYNDLRDLGYRGSQTLVKVYIQKHRDLVPAKRRLPAEGANRGRRYETPAGDCYQMDWGFVNVEDGLGGGFQYACFAMVCHHCGLRYVEFFTNARQENLFIGMIHAFSVMGVPKRVLTDNMKSVVVRRDAQGGIVYNKEYAAFQDLIGFKTDLCKVAHAFTKGRVERLIGFVKGNFTQGRSFINLNELNKAVAAWCREKNSKEYKENGVVPSETHPGEPHGKLPSYSQLLPYLAPERTVGFDGCVDYEGRRYGVPYKYHGKKVRVQRRGEKLCILDRDTGEEVQRHEVNWARKPKYCPGQWTEEHLQPEEHPTNEVEVSVTMRQRSAEEARSSRFRFNLKKEDSDE